MRASKNRPPASPGGDSAFAEIHSLANTLIALHQKRAAQLTAITEQLIREASRDGAEIERTLDHLLDCACIPEGLAPFKALCRYYYGINPAATASYVHGYRDMWDSQQTRNREAST
jgi:hypothetical protein